MKNKIISIVLSAAMLCPASFAVSNTNNKSKNENKIISYIKRNPIKTAIYSLGSLAFVTLSSYLVHRYVNSKKIEQKEIEKVSESPNLDTDLEQKEIGKIPVLIRQIPRRNVPTREVSKENRLLRKKNVFGFLACNDEGCSTIPETIQMFNDSAIYYDRSLEDKENNMNSLIKICKQVHEAIYSQSYTDGYPVENREIPPFVLIDGNFETVGNDNNNCKYKYWCEFKKDFEGNERTEKEITDKLSEKTENAEKICDFDHKIKDKTANFSLYREIIHEDPVDNIEINNKIPVIAKLREEKKVGKTKYPLNAIIRGSIPETNEDNLKHGLCLELLSNY